MTLDVEPSAEGHASVPAGGPFGYAGSSLPPKPVLDAVIAHVELEGLIGGYRAHAQNEQAVERFYGATAELIGAEPHEIAFCTEGKPRSCRLHLVIAPAAELTSGAREPETGDAPAHLRDRC
jgi:hypothetical protein